MTISVLEISTIIGISVGFTNDIVVFLRRIGKLSDAVRTENAFYTTVLVLSSIFINLNLGMGTSVEDIAWMQVLMRYIRIV